MAPGVAQLGHQRDQLDDIGFGGRTPEIGRQCGAHGILRGDQGGIEPRQPVAPGGGVGQAQAYRTGLVGS
jgi:hypothetical protein